MLLSVSWKHVLVSHRYLIVGCICRSGFFSFFDLLSWYVDNYRFLFNLVRACGKVHGDILPCRNLSIRCQCLLWTNHLLWAFCWCDLIPLSFNGVSHWGHDLVLLERLLFHDCCLVNWRCLSTFICRQHFVLKKIGISPYRCQLLRTRKSMIVLLTVCNMCSIWQPQSANRQST